MAPTVLVVANYIVIPVLINESSRYMGFKLKSERHRSVYFKHYLTLITNAFLIPLFGLTSVETLYAYITSTSMVAMELKILSTTNFFVKFLTSLCLVSNTFRALDLPHYIYRSLRLKCFTHCKPEYLQLSPQKYEDDYFFDVGY